MRKQARQKRDSQRRQGGGEWSIPVATDRDQIQGEAQIGVVPAKDLLLAGDVRAPQVPLVIRIELRYHPAQITPVRGGDFALDNADLAPLVARAESMRRRICGSEW